MKQALIYSGLLSALSLSSCSTAAPTPDTRGGPSLDFLEYFTGRTTSAGTIDGPNGKELESFTAVLDGRRKDDTLHLDQRFTFANGRKFTRQWDIRRTGERQYDIHATGITGPVKVDDRGNSIHLRYPMQLALEKREVNVTFDQWMWPKNEDVLLNRAVISKLGVRAATVTEEFTKR